MGGRISASRPPLGWAPSAPQAISAAPTATACAGVYRMDTAGAVVEAAAHLHVAAGGHPYRGELVGRGVHGWG